MFSSSASAIFDEVNKLVAAGVDGFYIESFAGSQLLVVGSNDLSYYHDIELTFTDVSYIRCETYFNAIHFRDVGATADGRRYKIKTDEGNFEIIAAPVAIAIGTVYRYDPGDKLQPGERIAPWVKRINS